MVSWFKRSSPGDKPEAATPAAAPSPALTTADLAGFDEDKLVEVACGPHASNLRESAVARLTSEDALKKVQRWAGDHDKRVYKAASARLRATRDAGKALTDAERIVVAIEDLASAPVPANNRVSELDRAWAVTAPHVTGTPWVERFQTARQTLENRLIARAQLQRDVRDLQALVDAAPDALVQMTDDEVQAQLADIAARVAAAAAAPESQSVPSTLMSALATSAEALPGVVAERRAAQAEPAAEAAVAPEAAADASTGASTEAAPVGGAEASAPVADVAAEGEPATDAAAPAGDAEAAPIAEAGADGEPAKPQRTKAEAKADRAAAKAKAEEDLPPPLPQEQADALVPRIEALLKMVDDGHIDQAVEENRQIEAAIGAYRLPRKAAAPWRRAQARLAELRGWQRFGAEQVRDGLLAEAHHLAETEMAPEARAKAVQTLRNRWKAIDSESRQGAPGWLWRKFDEACEKAYAPAAAHFAELAAKRNEVNVKREALIAELEARATALDEARAAGQSIDWKPIAAAADSARRHWFGFGPLERHRADQRKLAERFDAVLGRLNAPLDETRKGELAARRDLIERAKQLAEGEQRSGFGPLKALQEEWQRHAQQVPLPRSQEQALWTEFRAACDAYAASLKAERESQTTERRTRDNERVEQRKAVEGTFRDAIKAARDKVELIAKIEAAPNDERLRSRWIELGNAGKLERPLAARFNALRPSTVAAPSVDGAEEDPGAGAVALAESTMQPVTPPTAEVLQGIGRDLIALELEAGVASPPDAEADRKRLQFEMLANRLKHRTAIEDPAAQLQRLVGIAGTGASVARRVAALITAKNEWVANPPPRVPAGGFGDRDRGDRGGRGERRGDDRRDRGDRDGPRGPRR
ncbi:DUF349 domain-containing protein [Derxia gummosa]|uniref:DUF349 domain-containing protein n=1 Tax=Derxia gummosa DSM 723 TaxID=1121388 RepID=A0A8B6X787_9BURK|nr:DUF349 domain-containing protein [Derxia gummosa]